MKEEHQDKFIPYKEAKDLKKLGFDEPCLAKYIIMIKGHKIPNFYYNYLDEGRWFRHNSKDLTGYNGNGGKDWLWSAPMWEDAFEFFRKKFKLNSYIVSTHDGLWMTCHTSIPDRFGDWDGDNKYCKTYEEAQMECLKKLITIAKKIK